MSIQTVNLGTYANDSTGDDLRTAFEKSNANFTELDLTRVITADNLGSGAPVFKEKIANNLKLRSIKNGLNITVTYTDNEISIATPDSINAVEEDPNPKLGGDLNLNGKIAEVYCYASDLTDNEILQNFNATRARYGL